MMAYQTGAIDIHAKIKVRMTKEKDGEVISGIIDTTPGKLIFNDSIPQDLGFIDRSNPENEFKLEVDFLVTKKNLGKIIDKCYKDRKSTRLNSSHANISYAVFCLKKKKYITKSQYIVLQPDNQLH